MTPDQMLASFEEDWAAKDKNSWDPNTLLLWLILKELRKPVPVKKNGW